MTEQSPAARFKAITGCDVFPPTEASWSWSSWEERLAALAPQERRRLGVYTTPNELVNAVVDGVQEQLRRGFGLADGLADTSTWGDLEARGVVERPAAFDWDRIRDLPFVRVLDPACGTGVFPAAAWAASGASLAGRLHGVEIDPVAWGLSHLAVPAGQVELRRANGLDEWVPDAPVTVVLGNPPWSGLSENRGWIVDLLRGRIDGTSYYEVDGVPLGERKLWLQDDYVKFMRLAQYHIDRAGAGVVGYVTNHGWLDNPTFRGMRWALGRTFPTACVLDLGGNANRTQGPPDENVFGIRQGVAAAILSSHGDGRTRIGTLRGDAAGKLRKLAGGIAPLCPTQIVPTAPGFVLRPATPAHAEYAGFTPLTELFPLHTAGLVTARDKLVVGFSAEEVLARIQQFRDGGTDAEIRALFFPAKKGRYAPGDTRSWKLGAARERVRADPDWRLRVRPYYYRTLDVRWIYAARWMVDWGRPDVARHMDAWFGPEPGPAEPNLALVWMRQVSTGGAFSHVLVARQPVDNRCMRSSRGISTFAPLWVDGEPNLRLGAGFDGVDPMDALGFVYATLWSPDFVARHHDALCREVPRVPMQRFDLAVAARGRELMGLHLGETEAVGVGTPAELGGVDPAARFKRARTARGRVWSAAEQRRAASLARIAIATRLWQSGA